MQIQTPDWVKHAVFYQIFPDRFSRSQQFKQQLFHSVALEDWAAAPTLYGYKGGDLWGVVEKLDYLADLGITAIYFTPIFQSASNHRYHTHDYYKVDPLLGGNEAFKAMLDAAHDRGIKVVLDGVFNHASRGFFFFHDILENGVLSPWLDWFRLSGWPLSPYDGEKPANYACWDNNRALPEFNHKNPVVREYIMQVAEYWLRAGIDGWRLDVPECVQAEGFWQEFRTRIKAINPDAYIVGEIWNDASAWLDGTQFDGVMNYLFAAPTIAFSAGDRVQLEYIQGRSYKPYPALFAAEYGAEMERVVNLYPWEIAQTQLNLLASHDTARLLTIAGGDRASVEIATLLLLTFPGAPSIYYGDEVGLPGGIDPDSRQGFPSELLWDKELLEYHRVLIALRHSYIALRTGAYRVLQASGQTYVFARAWEDEYIVVAVNAGTEQTRAALDLDESRQTVKVLFGPGTAQLSDEKLELELPARSGTILSFLSPTVAA